LIDNKIMFDMKVLLLTDIHGNIEKLERIIYREDDFNVALCAGDISDARRFEDYEKRLKRILKVFDKQRKLTKLVPGNMDVEEVCIKNLIDYRMNLHKNICSFDNFEAVGFGGGQTPFDTPFEPSEDELVNTLETLYERMNDGIKVAVTHQPPYGLNVDITGGKHVGSQKLRKFFENKDFDLILTGHIHECRGIDKIGNGKIINPGSVDEGNYGIAYIDEEVEVELKSL